MRGKRGGRGGREARSRPGEAALDVDMDSVDVAGRETPDVSVARSLSLQTGRLLWARDTRPRPRPHATCWCVMCAKRHRP